MEGIYLSGNSNDILVDIMACNGEHLAFVLKYSKNDDSSHDVVTSHDWLARQRFLLVITSSGDTRYL